MNELADKFKELRGLASGASATQKERRIAHVVIDVFEQAMTDLHRIAAAMEEANRIAVAIESNAAMRRQLQPFDVMQQQQGDP